MVSDPYRSSYDAGHSLGGALATLAAFDIAKELQLRDISVVTFGAPRTGNRAFAREYEQYVPDTWHMINAKVGSLACAAAGIAGPSTFCVEAQCRNSKDRL